MREKRMRERHVMAGAVILVVILLSIFIFLNNVFLWEGLYPDSGELDKRINQEIKRLVLDGMKDIKSVRFSKGGDSTLYTDAYYKENAWWLTSHEDKHIFIFIDNGFMSQIEKTGDIWADYYWYLDLDAKYLVNVKCQDDFFESYEYTFVITEEGGRYRIADVGRSS